MFQYVKYLLYQEYALKYRGQVFFGYESSNLGQWSVCDTHTPVTYASPPPGPSLTPPITFPYLCKRITRFSEVVVSNWKTDNVCS